MSAIPPPSNVAQVWLASDEALFVHFPADNDGRGHTVHLSADVYGLTCLLQILIERRNKVETIGRPSTPSQWDVERALQKIKLSTGTPKVPDVRKLSREDREVLRGANETERRKAKKIKASEALLAELGLL